MYQRNEGNLNPKKEKLNFFYFSLSIVHSLAKSGKVMMIDHLFLKMKGTYNKKHPIC